MRLSSRYLFPIAEGTDPRRNHPAVVDGPRTEGIEAELGRIDDRLADMRYSLMRRGIWAGGVISAPTTTTISFGATFAAPPDLMLSWYDGQYGIASSNNVSTTGATLLAVPISGSTIVRVAWIAFGMKP